MKAAITVCTTVILLFVTMFAAMAGIIAGPITNPANGHDYYLLSPNTWRLSEGEAEVLGGTLIWLTNCQEGGLIRLPIFHGVHYLPLRNGLLSRQRQQSTTVDPADMREFIWSKGPDLST